MYFNPTVLLTLRPSPRGSCTSPRGSCTSTSISPYNPLQVSAGHTTLVDCALQCSSSGSGVWLRNICTLVMYGCKIVGSCSSAVQVWAGVGREVAAKVVGPFLAELSGCGIRFGYSRCPREILDFVKREPLMLPLADRHTLPPHTFHTRWMPGARGWRCTIASSHSVVAGMITCQRTSGPSTCRCGSRTGAKGDEYAYKVGQMHEGGRAITKGVIAAYCLAAC